MNNTTGDLHWTIPAASGVPKVILMDSTWTHEAIRDIEEYVDKINIHHFDYEGGRNSVAKDIKEIINVHRKGK